MTNSRFGAAFGLLVKRRRAERGLSQDQLAAILWPERAGPKDHPNKPQLSRLESGKTANPQEKTVLALCEALGIRKDEVNALRLAPPPDPYALAKVLADLKSASQSDLYALARAFGDNAPDQRSDTTLRAFLTDKAQEHANYRKIIAALDDRVAAIANLKGAAQDAAARLDFDEVETLLSRVSEVELDIAAATTEARAENALLQGNAEKAYTLFSAAADSFAAIGPVEVAKRRNDYSERLTKHGVRYGRTGLPLAIRLLDRLFADLPRDASPLDWANAQNTLGLACRNLGERSVGTPGAVLLARAIKAFEAALQVNTRADHTFFWAGTLQNLAGALFRLGERTTGEAGTAYLARAVEAFEAALQVTTHADHQLYWAGTLQNLAGALQRQGERTEGEAGTALLQRAVAALEGALQIRSYADHPFDWATTMQNLAGALQEQGNRTMGDAGIALLSRAVETFEATLLVRTPADHPVDWAITQESLAICHAHWSQHPACDDPPAHLRQALAQVENALSVYDPGHMPFYHEKATRLRETILSALARNP